MYYKGDCFSPLQQGPCREGEWLVMEREEGVCKKMPCESPIQFLKNGECIFGVDMTKRGKTEALEFQVVTSHTRRAVRG